ncbi:MAG: hypothetical protein ACKO1F_13640 [Flammeovirgaceae bacterium]
MGSTLTERDLTNEIVSAFPAKAFSVGVEERKKALGHFEKLGLPTTKSEEYRFIPITKSLLKNSNWNVDNSTSAIVSIDEFLIEGMDASVFVFINGIYFEKLSRIIHSPREVTVSSLEKSLLTNTEVLRC